MIKFKNADLKLLTKKPASAEEATKIGQRKMEIINDLMKFNTAYDLASSVVDQSIAMFNAEKDVKKISATREQIEKHFNVIG